ncbi:hydrogenase maturation factor [Mobiluncus mulieris]|uniref:Hydrogenase assembly chaperone HypC/HupF n=1 Tax=Mobiluncus mulieris TaxID=2052 RepID=A0A8G2M699_9ACTO|nr:HypC/HybG/HupF family hydrogenase formation chaperone [Mobiluncus mulieris]EEJ53165.1 hypothetical protein HMPREF0577_1840 [Mobiluncus mulieris ATCC 35243]MBB5847350.1 hydrogenase maturation factor [Mobiluncus mulieris]MCV0002295.1 HypC/HybG/HupF family hydrogenase formation chaperone [Mobiluncus mulieris]MCV0011481.1 HypC/HybG/HupF family hydrogenase formation chaperone [Mobiluncus mulieris]NMX00847.1 sedoheptulose 7-phosphate isomerase [Mobiluncus mulieris]
MTEIKISDKLSASLTNLGVDNPRGEVCITCSDEARPLEILDVSPDMTTAVARSESGKETVDVSLVAPVAPGDKILVHAGLAITKVEA